jgi:hypothetical protein
MVLEIWLFRHRIRCRSFEERRVERFFAIAHSSFVFGEMDTKRGVEEWEENRED